MCESWFVLGEVSGVEFQHYINIRRVWESSACVNTLTVTCPRLKIWKISWLSIINRITQGTFVNVNFNVCLLLRRNTFTFSTIDAICWRSKEFPLVSCHFPLLNYPINELTTIFSRQSVDKNSETWNQFGEKRENKF